MNVLNAYDTIDDMLKAKYPKYKTYDLLSYYEKHKIEKGKYKPACYVAITDGDFIVTKFLFAAVDKETESEFILFFGPEFFGPEGIGRYIK